jgi:hypothetical protein
VGVRKAPTCLLDRTLRPLAVPHTFQHGLDPRAQLLGRDASRVTSLTTSSALRVAAPNRVLVAVVQLVGRLDQECTGVAGRVQHAHSGETLEPGGPEGDERLPLPALPCREASEKIEHRPHRRWIEGSRDAAELRSVANRLEDQDGGRVGILRQHKAPLWVFDRSRVRQAHIACDPRGEDNCLPDRLADTLGVHVCCEHQAPV